MLDRISTLALNMLVIILHNAVMHIGKENSSEGSDLHNSIMVQSSKSFGELLKLIVNMIGERGLTSAKQKRVVKSSVHSNSFKSSSPHSNSPIHSGKSIRGPPPIPIHKLPSTKPWSDACVKLVRSMLYGVIRKTAGKALEFRHEHEHAAWTNLFQALDCFQELMAYDTPTYYQSIPPSTFVTNINVAPKKPLMPQRIILFDSGLIKNTIQLLERIGVSDTVMCQNRWEVEDNEATIECENEATMECKGCKFAFCDLCDKTIHKHKEKKNHTKTKLAKNYVAFGMNNNQRQKADHHKRKGKLYYLFFQMALKLLQEAEEIGTDMKMVANILFDTLQSSKENKPQLDLLNTSMKSPLAKFGHTPKAKSIFEPMDRKEPKSNMVGIGPSHHNLIVGRDRMPSKAATDSFRQASVDLGEGLAKINDEWIRKKKEEARISALERRLSEHDIELNELILKKSTEIKMIKLGLKLLEQEEADCAMDSIRLEVSCMREEELAIGDILQQHFEDNGGEIVLFVFNCRNLNLRIPDLQNPQKTMAPDSYITITYKKKKFKTCTVKKSSHPRFDGKFTIKIDSGELGKGIRFRAYHIDKWQKVFLGEITVSVSQMLFLAVQQKDVWIQFRNIKSDRHETPTSPRNKMTYLSDEELNKETNMERKSIICKNNKESEHKADTPALHIIVQLTFDPYSFKSEIINEVPQVKALREALAQARARSENVTKRLQKSIAELENASVLLARLRRRKNLHPIIENPEHKKEYEGDESDDDQDDWDGNDMMASSVVVHSHINTNRNRRL